MTERKVSMAAYYKRKCELLKERMILLEALMKAQDRVYDALNLEERGKAYDEYEDLCLALGQFDHRHPKTRT